MNSLFIYGDDMNRVFYFNIIYRCNINCKFCFSNSTSNNGSIMDSKQIINSIINKQLDKDDLIVINGGEPAVHKELYSILHELIRITEAEIAVYSNGSMLDVLKLPKSDKLFFVIPIHGFEASHDGITQMSGSYKKTFNVISLLDIRGFRYRLKFIINKNMVEEKFDIRDFLEKNHMQPEEIIIARLNETNKSRINHVLLPTTTELSIFLNIQVANLNNSYKVKLLDIPPCYIGNILDINSNANIPIFYFNDFQNLMKVHDYYKEVMIGSGCKKCRFYSECKVMKHTYLTLQVYKNIYSLERE